MALMCVSCDLFFPCHQDEFNILQSDDISDQAKDFLPYAVGDRIPLTNGIHEIHFTCDSSYDRYQIHDTVQKDVKSECFGFNVNKVNAVGNVLSIKSNELADIVNGIKLEEDLQLRIEIFRYVNGPQQLELTMGDIFMYYDYISTTENGISISGSNLSRYKELKISGSNYHDVISFKNRWKNIVEKPYIESIYFNEQYGVLQMVTSDGERYWRKT